MKPRERDGWVLVGVLLVTIRVQSEIISSLLQRNLVNLFAWDCKANQTNQLIAQLFLLRRLIIG